MRLKGGVKVTSHYLPLLSMYDNYYLIFFNKVFFGIDDDNKLMLKITIKMIEDLRMSL